MPNLEIEPATQTGQSGMFRSRCLSNLSTVSDSLTWWDQMYFNTFYDFHLYQPLSATRYNVPHSSQGNSSFRTG
eukprot:1976086-Rhodomonas_salina.1